jgi:hypothetical protein
MATSKEDDPMWMLRTFYFLPCDLMHQHAMEVRRRLDKGEIRDGLPEQYITYMLYWLGGLFVVAEGWRELKINDSAIDKMLTEHCDSLRLFRNAVFHFQLTDRKHVQFFDPEKFNWATRLHLAIRAYFAAKDR